MIESEGKNNLKDNVFDFREWSAPVLETPEELIEKLQELKLEGRVIKDIVAVGKGYNWREDDISESFPDFDYSSNIPKPIDPNRVSLIRYAELDEPLLFLFEDGDILARLYESYGKR